MIIIGPGLNTGIGKHALKYSKLFGRGYYLLGDKLPEAERGLVFMLPVRWHMEYLTYIRTRVKDLQCMTVC